MLGTCLRRPRGPFGAAAAAAAAAGDCCGLSFCLLAAVADAVAGD